MFFSPRIYDKTCKCGTSFEYFRWYMFMTEMNATMHTYIEVILFKLPSVS